MPISRYLLVVVSMFLVVLFVYHACFCDGKDFASPDGGVVAHRWPEADEFHPTASAVPAAPVDVTPARALAQRSRCLCLRIMDAS
jgi:hypothetical protein